MTLARVDIEEKKLQLEASSFTKSAAEDFNPFFYMEKLDTSKLKTL